jgi:soluble lytic murein transglycosylase
VIAIGVLGGVLIGLESKVDKVIQELTLPLRHEDVIRQEAAQHGVKPELIAAVIYAESRFRDQTSSAGARGLMQITPDTARGIERRSGGTTFELKDLADPDVNIAYGSFHLRELLDRYGGNEVAALAAYNAGPGNADKWGGAAMELEDIGFPETAGYVGDVLDKQEAYRQKYAKELGY